jgi:hypothetical protein
VVRKMGEYILNLIRAPEGSRDKYVTNGSETFSAVMNFLRKKYRVPEDNPIRLETVSEDGKRIAIDPAKKISDIFPKEGEYNIWWYSQKSFGGIFGNKVKSSIKEFAEDVVHLVEIYKDGWRYLNPKKPSHGAYRFFVCYRTDCPCSFTDHVHAVLILPSFLYPKYPPQVWVIPKVKHLCCYSIRESIPRELKKTIFKGLKQHIGCVHWEENGYWRSDSANRLETVAIALKEEFRIF